MALSGPDSTRPFSSWSILDEPPFFFSSAFDQVCRQAQLAHRVELHAPAVTGLFVSSREVY